MTSYHQHFADLMKQLADKYDHLPNARLTGPVCQDQLEEDALADDFLRAYTNGQPDDSRS